MAARLDTRWGHAVPPVNRHSVTVQMPTWTGVEKFGSDPRAGVELFYNAYPRMKPHRDIAALANAVLQKLGTKSEACLLLCSLQSARECIEYATSPKRDDGQNKKSLDRSMVSIKCFAAKDKFYAVMCPVHKIDIVGSFWYGPGVGISSRFAETNLESLAKLQEIAVSDEEQSCPSYQSSAHEEIKARLLQFLNRATIREDVNSKVQMSDIYLFPSGMATIYKPHTYLCQSSAYAGTTVLFGMAFLNTVTLFQDFGIDYRFFGLGTDQDLRDLETFLAQEKQAGRKVQAIWAEFPTNPILVTPDLTELRRLADQYDTLLAIDDTIGSLANIDVLHMADIMVASLTKSFNGYADVIAGSVILNPVSRHYTNLKDIFEKCYVPELYTADAEQLNQNSRDYLVRSAKLNHNAWTLVEWIDKHARENETSSIARVHYPHPSINSSAIHYQKVLRNFDHEDNFTPGYGCLFNIELKDLHSARIFYDHINVYTGPHLGLTVTLAFAYTACVYLTKLDWAESYGLRPTQIRISAGLEDTDELLKTFQDAIRLADDDYRRRLSTDTR